MESVLLFDLLNQDPGEVMIGQGKEKPYEYVPVSYVQRKMDEIFSCNWDFDLESPSFGKGAVSAKGLLTVNYNGLIIKRSGVAAVVYKDGIQLDYPLLKTRVFLNAAKSLGKIFGRDLNREVEDVISKEVEEDEADKELRLKKDALKEVLWLAPTYEAALQIISKSEFPYDLELKELAKSKPSNIL